MYTIKDLAANNPNYKSSWDAATNTATLTNTANGKSISWGINNGAQYGLGSSENAIGSHEIVDYNKLVGALSDTKPTNTVAPQSTYTSPYKTNIANIVNQLAARQSFQYNPDTDAGFQNAAKQVQKQALETANSRGIVNSSVASGEASQAVANIMPQYEQLAYSRYNDETQNMLNKLNVLNQLDSQSYQQYQDQIQNDFEQQKIDIQKNQQEIDKQQNKISNAWKAVQNLGYVDNESSIALGVPVGTPSWEAKNAAEQRIYELDKMKQEYQLEDQKLDKQHAQDIEIINLKDQYDKENTATQHTYNMEENQQKGDIDFRNSSAIEGQRSANNIALENIRSANDLNIAQVKANSSASSIDAGDIMKNASNYINTYFTTDENGTRVLTMQNKRDIASYIYNLAASGSAPEQVTDTLFAQYDINYDFLREMGLAN